MSRLRRLERILRLCGLLGCVCVALFTMSLLRVIQKEMVRVNAVTALYEAYVKQTEAYQVVREASVELNDAVSRLDDGRQGDETTPQELSRRISGLRPSLLQVRLPGGRDAQWFLSSLDRMAGEYARMYQLSGDGRAVPPELFEPYLQDYLAFTEALTILGLQLARDGKQNEQMLGRMSDGLTGRLVCAFAAYLAGMVMTMLLLSRLRRSMLRQLGRTVR